METYHHDSAWNSLKRHWVSSLGIQAWLLDTARSAVSRRVRTIVAHVDPQLASTGKRPEPGVWPGAPDTHSVEGLGELIETLRQALVQLDDVRDYALVEALDNRMYQLWKELERTMQRHRRSEARYQLKEMFRI